jgi:hypothetical protein
MGRDKANIEFQVSRTYARGAYGPVGFDGAGLGSHRRPRKSAALVPEFLKWFCDCYTEVLVESH